MRFLFAVCGLIVGLLLGMLHGGAIGFGVGFSAGSFLSADCCCEPTCSEYVIERIPAVPPPPPFRECDSGGIVAIDRRLGELESQLATINQRTEMIHENVLSVSRTMPVQPLFPDPTEPSNCCSPSTCGSGIETRSPFVTEQQLAAVLKTLRELIGANVARLNARVDALECDRPKPPCCPCR